MNIFLKVEWFSSVVLNLPNDVVLKYSIQVVVTSNHKVISLLLPNFNFAKVMNRNINACVFQSL